MSKKLVSMTLQNKLITEIENLAGKKGKSMKDICERAGISYSLFWRWKNGTCATVSKIDLLKQAAEKF